MAGVYISYPFCNQKCTFCNFASEVSTRDSISRYETALLAEVRSHRWDWSPQTIYLGGGTPSLMNKDALRELMAAIPRTAVTESTMECAPGTLTLEKVHAWMDVGINRVSLGVQSFVDTEARNVGRRHTAQIVASDVALLREVGLGNINIDLIAGLPNQTSASWSDSLAWIERLQPPHVSVYIFEIDEDSRLGREFLSDGSRYGATCLPDNDTIADFYEQAVAYLTGRGIYRYEISNFAKPSWESRHNLKYWQLEPYVGFGLDAHSFDGARRWSNPDSLLTYLNGRAADSPVCVDTEEEHLFVGLRLTAGIEPTPKEWARFADPINKWVGEGLLQKQGNRLRLSDRGILVSNEIFQEFLHA